MARTSMSIGQSVFLTWLTAPQGIYLAAFSWAWDHKYPDIPLDSLQPVKKLKSAVRHYVDGVEVTQDDRIVMAAEVPRKAHWRWQCTWVASWTP